MHLGLKTACGLVIAGLAAGMPARVHADPLTVKTVQGKAHGKTINDGKVKAFLGLPYAAAPVGDLRWKAPQPALPWKGERDATSFGARCAQNRIWDDMIFEDSGPSEDCLFLNVYAPADAKAKSKLPVMFWIHGGGYVAGASSEPRHNGDFLPHNGVVLVTINYGRSGERGQRRGGELRLARHGGRAPVGQGQHRQLRRRSRERDHLRRERRFLCGQHADCVTRRPGALSQSHWRKRGGLCRYASDRLS
jgi:hypothetical protein